MNEITPKSVILDLLRVAPEAGPAAVSALVEVGKVFGFHAAAMRVAVSRLVVAGLLESDERGLYRLTTRALPLGQLVEEWRRGEQRLRPWESDWLAVSWCRPARRADSRANQRALTRLGLRPTLEPLWMRPDNLALGRKDLAQCLDELGFVGSPTLFRARGFPPALVRGWAVEKWEIHGLERAYELAITNLDASCERLPSLPLAAALVETFVHGGDAIGTLAFDPLLPDELFSGERRRALTAKMLAYEEIGRGRWQELIAEKRVLCEPPQAHT